jgi:heme A synthase
MTRNHFARFSWGLLGYNVLVILWGALVRATGSGAGCGGHWPTCNGQAIPLAPTTETLIEYSHRLSSALDGILVAGLAIGALRLFPKGHPVRAAALASLALTIVEGLIGATLVRLELVADNASPLRGLVVGLHLANTFLLLASLALSAWWASGGAAIELRSPARVPLGLGAAATLAVGASGAIAALGDTLFPAASLAEGLAQDASPAAHLFVQLRALHPALAVGAGILLIAIACLHGLPHPGRAVRRLALGLIALVGLQWTVGVVNVLLLAPVWMQLIHLLLADAVWITFVLMGAGVLRREAAPHQRAARAFAGRVPTGD